MPAPASTPWVGLGLERVLLVIATTALIVVCWANFRLLAHWSWSACRLAMMFRPAYGLPLYPPPDAPAINDWMYGPVASFAYLPAALARDPLGALRVASWLNAIYFLLAPVVVFACVGRAKPERTVAMWGFVFCIAAMLLPVGVWYGAAVLQVDTLTICLGVLSCFAVVHGRWWLAAVLCVLAVWTKQVAAGLILAQLIFVAWSGGFRRAAAHALRFGAVMAGVTALCVVAFGARNLWFNLVVVVSHYSFDLGRLGGILAHALSATWWILPVTLAAGKWLPLRRGPGEDRNVQLAWLLMLAAVILLPVGLAAAIKYGGSQNSIHSLAYGIIGASLFATLLARKSARLISHVARIGLIVAAVGVVGLKLHRVERNGYVGAEWSGERHRAAYEFVKTRPGQAYFPANPLVTLMAEGREYPFEPCYRELVVTQRAPSVTAMRALFPESLSFVIYHQLDDPKAEMGAVFADFAQMRVSGPWTFFTLPERGQSPTAAER